MGLRAGADVPGAVLVTGALMLGVYTIVDAESWALGAVAVALLAAFVVRQATAERPLLRLGLLKSRDVAGANVVQMVAVAGMLGMSFLAVLYLQRVLGYDAFATGVSFLPISLAIGVLSLGFSARLIMRFGARTVLLPALALMAAGLWLLGQAGVDGRYFVDVLPALLLMGIGAGLVLPGADDARDVRRRARGLRLRERAREHDPAGRRRLRHRDPGVRRGERTGGATDPASLVAGYSAAFELAAALASGGVGVGGGGVAAAAGRRCGGRGGAGRCRALGRAARAPRWLGWAARRTRNERQLRR